MRICLSHLRQSSGMGGTERYLNQLVVFLCDRGHEVTLLCRSHDESPHPGLRIVVLHDFALGPAWRRWAFARAVERHQRTSQYDVTMALGRTWGQDVIHIGAGTYQTHLDHKALELAQADAQKARLRLRPTDRVALAIERRALQPGAYRRVLVNSEMVKRDVMQRYAVPEQAMCVIHHGVDTQQFHPRHRERAGAELRRALGYATDEQLFLFLASGFRRKGLDLLLEAFPAVLQSCAKARLVVVGRDSAQPDYEAQARRLGIAQAVRFLGPRRDAEACYGAADVYVLPTRYDGFGLTVLDAMASGLPVVTTDTCGAAELIRPGQHGSVVALGEGLDALRAGLLQWTDRSRSAAAGQAARRQAELHDMAGKLAATESLLKEVAAERARDARRA
jgi:UDP-glucose:(heptosyl)LPS alpha-1,3-glucosyltransferase